MAERTTIARPYAAAVFQFAESQNALKQWSDMLQLAKMVVSDSQVMPLLNSPKVTSVKLAELVISVGGNEFSESMQRVIKLLAENKRLGYLSEIAHMFDALKADAEKVVQAHVMSAKPLSDAEKDALEKSLGKRLGKAVSVDSEVDESLIGGAIIRADDLVIDGSVRGKLSRLSSALTH